MTKLKAYDGELHIGDRVALHFYDDMEEDYYHVTDGTIEALKANGEVAEVDRDDGEEGGGENCGWLVEKQCGVWHADEDEGLLILLNPIKVLNWRERIGK